MQGQHNLEPCVYVVEDDPGMSTLYRELLESSGFAAQFFASGEEFFSAWSPSWQGGLVLDLRMPGMGGIEVLERLRNMSSPLPVIIVTGFGEVRSSVQAMKLGAVDFLEKPFVNDEFIATVEAMLVQGHHNTLVHAMQDEWDAALATLSTREREVSELIARGMTSREIGALLTISPRTVDVHRARALDKLNCSSSVELAAFLTRFSPGV